LVIDAAVGGVPTPTTSWTVNGQPLTPTAQLKVDVTPTASKLTIMDASAGHSGTYTLKAENVVGTASAEFTIAVKGGTLSHRRLDFKHNLTYLATFQKGV